MKAGSRNPNALRSSPGWTDVSVSFSAPLVQNQFTSLKIDAVLLTVCLFVCFSAYFKTSRKRWAF